MTDQHRATPEQWAQIERSAEEVHGDGCSAILELRARIEALEAAQLEQAESHRFCTDAIVRRVEALEATQHAHADLSRLSGAEQDRIAQELAKPAAWRPLETEITYGSEAAADAAQILHAPMVVQGTFDHGGETYRFKAKPERESAMTELRTASAEAQPAGGLVEMLGDVWSKGQPLNRYARVAAIRTVATWLDRFALHGSGEYAQAAKVLRQEVGQ
jgi:hypothetical protein